MKRLLSLIFILVAYQASASHNKAGEITYRQVTGLTYEITIVTYTENGTQQSRDADRPFLTVEWGDGTRNDVNRISQQDLPNDTWKNTYRARHTYVGPGQFKVYFVDPNRVEDIVNMTGSFNTKFYVECVIRINPFLGVNQSPILLLPPIDFACTNRKFIHNPVAHDPDGDSLVFTVIPPKQDLGSDVQGFFIPPASIAFTLDPQNGELVWNAPMATGKYNIAILIREFRNGVEIGSVVRDMQIVVDACNNIPPEIDAVKDTCIEIGKTLTIQVRATDPGDNIKLTALGAPFEVAGNKATFTPFAAITKNVATATFSWRPSCDQIRKSPYQVVFRAEDQHTNGINLVDLEFFNITLVGPAPKNPDIQQFEDGFILRWDKDSCQEAVGYNVYRRIDSSKWKPDPCVTGVAPEAGFVLYHTLLGYDNNEFYDDEGGLGLAPGSRYCYRVTSIFAQKGFNNQPIYSAAVEGKSSLEVCDEILKDRPVITNVSVLRTDNDSGHIWIAWSKPDTLDTLDFPGPYKYVIYRSNDKDGKNFIPIDSIIHPSFALFNDSSYLDTIGLNTLGVQYAYKIEFYSDSFGLKRQYIGKSRPASSIYLICIPDDEALILRWNNNVQWHNFRHVIYRWNESSLQYDSIGQSAPMQTYRDEGLINLKEYKYYVRSIGQFSVPGYVFPVINLSQEATGIPNDTTPPCPPVLNATTDCIHYKSYLKWNNPNNSCAKDVIGYKVYFKSILENSMMLIDSFGSVTDTTYLDQRPVLSRSVAGCYYVTAIDSFLNESKKSLASCVDNCPEYRLPNVFTPGKKDELNDRFGPFPYRYVRRVDMNIYNRWGQQVFQTHDPDIQWDGTDARSGKEVSPGVYFYVCTVYELRLEGVNTRILKGTIELIR